MRRFLLALLVPLALPASAAADDVLRSGPVVRDGLALVEDGAVWVRELGTNTAAVMGARPGGPPRALVRSGNSYTLSGGGGVAAFTTWRGVWAGTAEAMPQVYVPLPRCSPHAAGVDAGVMAVAFFCGDRAHVVVRGPDGTERLLPAAGYEVEVAGRYVAWTVEGYAGDGGTVVLYDAVEHREVLRVGRPREPSGGGGPGLSPIGLQPDGKLLVAVDRWRDADTAWVSPEDPALHRLGILPGDVEAFAGDRVMTLTAETDSNFTPAPRPGGRTRVELVGLDGSRRLLASTRDGPQVSAADYDGRRVALARMTCDGTHIVLRSAAEPPLSLSGDGLCPLRVTGPMEVAFGKRPAPGRDDRPRVRVRVRCALWTLRQCGWIVLRTLDGQVLSHVNRRFTRDDTWTVTLLDEGVRRIARSGSMRVRVEMHYHRTGEVPLQRPATAILRVSPAVLARLRRCVRERSRPSQGCPAVRSAERADRPD